MRRKCNIRLEGDASVNIGRVTLTSPKRMILDFMEEKNTFTISFNQKRQKMQNIFCDTSVDEKSQDVAWISDIQHLRYMYNS